MNQLVLVATLSDASGALERLLGLLRRSALHVETLSMYRAEANVLEVALRFGKLRTPEARVEALLNDLVDVREVRRVWPEACAKARELALARTDGDPGPWPDELQKVVRRQSSGSIELTGSPREIDTALAHMKERGVLAASVRSGEMYPPHETNVS
jgi:acetolactate synthase small subunit